jgi:hypothetical protein
MPFKFLYSTVYFTGFLKAVYTPEMWDTRAEISTTMKTVDCLLGTDAVYYYK